MFSRFKKKHAPAEAPGAGAVEAPDHSDSPGTDNPEPGISLSKELIDFKVTGSAVIPLDTSVHDTIDIVNRDDYSVRFKFEPCFQREFQLSFNPAEGNVKAKANKSIKVKLNVHAKINTNYRATVNIEGVGARFVIVKIRCESGVFGVDPSSLEQIVDPAGRRVPVVLNRLREVLFERGGLEQEGVFRLASEATELKAAKARLNAGEMSSQSMPADVNAIATLIKVWFRELPTPLLNALPKERIFLVSEEDCGEAVTLLPEPQRTLLEWLLDLLLVIAENRKVNKMTAQNLAIVVAPNLYEPRCADPMEGLVLSQKAVQFIHALLSSRARQRAAVDIDLRPDESAMQPISRQSPSPAPAPKAPSPRPAPPIPDRPGLPPRTASSHAMGTPSAATLRSPPTYRHGLAPPEHPRPESLPESGTPDADRQRRTHSTLRASPLSMGSARARHTAGPAGAATLRSPGSFAV